MDVRKEQKELRHDGPKVEGGGEGGMRLYWWVGLLRRMFLSSQLWCEAREGALFGLIF